MYVYEITADIDNENYSRKLLRYIGSTKNYPDYRFSNHKSSYKTNTNSTYSSKVFELYGVSNCCYKILGKYKNKYEMETKEKEFIRNLGDKVVNKNC